MEHDRSAGASAWDASLLPEPDHVGHVMGVMPALTALRWTTDYVRYAGNLRDAYVIESGNPATRDLLERELIHRHHDRLFSFNIVFEDILAALANAAATGTEAYVEIEFETTADGRGHLRDLVLLPSEAVRRLSAGFQVDDRKMSFPVGSGAVRKLPRDRMISALDDLPHLEPWQQQQVVSDYWFQRVLAFDQSNALRVQAEPTLIKGLRWQLSVLRRTILRGHDVRDARIAHTLGGSLIDRALYHDRPGLTRYFYRWQHHQALRRARALRRALVDVLNERVVATLVRMNGLADARLVARDVLDDDALEARYERSQAEDEDPIKLYSDTMWSRERFAEADQN